VPTVIPPTPLQWWHRFGLVWSHIARDMRLMALPSDDGWMDATRSNIAAARRRT
jgi:hypothetical protein